MLLDKKMLDIKVWNYNIEYKKRRWGNMRTRIRENFNRITTKFEIMIEYI